MDSLFFNFSNSLFLCLLIIDSISFVISIAYMIYYFRRRASIRFSLFSRIRPEYPSRFPVALLAFAVRVVFIFLCRSQDPPSLHMFLFVLYSIFAFFLTRIVLHVFFIGLSDIVYECRHNDEVKMMRWSNEYMDYFEDDLEKMVNVDHDGDYFDIIYPLIVNNIDKYKFELECVRKRLRYEYRGSSLFRSPAPYSTSKYNVDLRVDYLKHFIYFYCDLYYSYTYHAKRRPDFILKIRNYEKGKLANSDMPDENLINFLNSYYTLDSRVKQEPIPDYEYDCDDFNNPRSPRKVKFR